MAKNISLNTENLTGPQLTFVYGTLKKGFGNNYHMRNSTFVSKAKTEDKFNLYSAGIPYLTKMGTTSHVHGELYETPLDDLLGPIDRLEGHPTFYKRELISIIDENNNKSMAWAYFVDRINPDRVSLLEDGIYK